MIHKKIQKQKLLMVSLFGTKKEVIVLPSDLVKVLLNGTVSHLEDLPRHSLLERDRLEMKTKKTIKAFLNQNSCLFYSKYENKLFIPYSLNNQRSFEYESAFVKKQASHFKELLGIKEKLEDFDHLLKMHERAYGMPFLSTSEEDWSVLLDFVSDQNSFLKVVDTVVVLRKGIKIERF